MMSPWGRWRGKDVGAGVFWTGSAKAGEIQGVAEQRSLNEISSLSHGCFLLQGKKTNIITDLIIAFTNTECSV